ncbi:MAG: hypothetical protein AB7T32_06770 [Dehalococcoidia bacterium]
MMMRHSRRGLILALAAVSALLLIAGLAYATTTCCDDSDETAVIVTGTPSATATSVPATATAAVPTPIATATPSPDTSVSSPPLPPAPTPGTTVPPTPVPPDGVSTLPQSQLLPLKTDYKRMEAPIDGLDIAVMESFPAQYLLQIEAGLPNGCAEKGGYEATRSGTTINVKVYYATPTAGGICTMIYGIYELNINLGSDYVSGQTYTVNVNDKTMTFKAQ